MVTCLSVVELALRPLRAFGLIDVSPELRFAIYLKKGSLINNLPRAFIIVFLKQKYGSFAFAPNTCQNIY